MEDKKKYFVEVQAIADDDLEGVAGGSYRESTEQCPYCLKHYYVRDILEHVFEEHPEKYFEWRAGGPVDPLPENSGEQS